MRAKPNKGLPTQMFLDLIRNFWQNVEEFNIGLQCLDYLGKMVGSVTFRGLNAQSFKQMFKFIRHMEVRSTTSRAPPGRCSGGTGWPRTRGSSSASPLPMVTRQPAQPPPAPRRLWGATLTTTGMLWTPTPSMIPLLCAAIPAILPAHGGVHGLILDPHSRHPPTLGMIQFSPVLATDDWQFHTFRAEPEKVLCPKAENFFDPGPGKKKICLIDRDDYKNVLGAPVYSCDSISADPRNAPAGLGTCRGDVFDGNLGMYVLAGVKL